ncbi:MAG: YqaA family protein [Nitrososphaerales archaeon]
MKPPIHVPAIVGAPAIKPNVSKCVILAFCFAIGAIIASPSVVLCMVNPITRNFESASDPNTTAAPIANPSIGPYYASVSTAGSVMGGIAGYYIGLKGRRPLARKLFPASKIKRVEDYFEKYGAWAVLIAGFSPVPYKIFTIASGIVRLDTKRFVLASAVGRGVRFFAETSVIMIWGSRYLNS